MCPILLAFAALPGSGLVLLPALGFMAVRQGEGALWFVIAFCTFFFGVGTYAFGKAAWAKQVRCRRVGAELEVIARGVRSVLAADRVRLAVHARTFGINKPVTVHMVILMEAPRQEEYVVYAGLLACGARRAAARIAAHLEVRTDGDEPTR